MKENKIDDGGLVCPVPVSSGYGMGFFSVNLQGEREFVSIEGGLTLRDYFAGQALAGITACPGGNTRTFDCEASYCYTLADAMIEARQARKVLKKDSEHENEKHYCVECGNELGCLNWKTCSLSRA